MRRTGAALVAAALMPLAAACHDPAPPDSTPHGVLDERFGSAGLVSDDIAHGQDAAKSVFVDAEGRIVLLGRAQDVSQSFDGNLAVLRLDSAGGLDATFGTGGIAQQDLGSQEDAGLALVELGDGRLRTAGLFVTTNGRALVSVAGFGADGANDPAFGAAGAPILTPLGTSLDGISRPLALDGADRLLVAGADTGGMALLRLDAEGAPDPSFGTAGETSVAVTGHDSVYALLVQPDGKVVATGSGGGAMEIARFLPDGAIDVAFGTGGSVLQPFLQGLETGRAIVRQPDGKLVVLVVDENVTGGIDAILARYDGAGQPDLTFGAGAGWVSFEFSTQYVGGTDLALQSDGKLVVAGTHYDLDYAFELARFLPDGAPDLGFGDAGRLITPFHSSAFGSAITLQPDGKILVAGNAEGDWYTDFAVARYLP